MHMLFQCWQRNMKNKLIKQNYVYMMLNLCVSGEAVVDMATWVTHACDWTEHLIINI